MTSAWDASRAPAGPWRSGPWSLELRDDELADIAYDGVVLLRAVRAVARDRDWGTAAIVVESVDASATALELRVRSRGLGSSFSGTIAVEADGAALAVSCDLVSAAAFDTNRTGLVVLHPPSLAGTPLVVTRRTGEERTRFPEAISPHQPALDVTGLAWSQAGLEIDIRLGGDVFEMEDQRNWTDASYKTYSRPLALPFPYRVAAGEHVRQSLRLAVRGRAGPVAAGGARERLALVPTGAPFPAVGIAAATAPDPAPDPASPPPPFVLVELDLADRAWPAALARAAASGAPLDVRLVLHDADPDAVEGAAAALVGLDVLRVAAFAPVGAAAHVSDRAAVLRLRAALAAAGVETPVVGGARSHFTQLNREQHRLPDDLDGIVLSTTPLFHSTTTEQLVESISMQRLVAEQAVLIAAGRPVHVGPVTLRPRFNDVATAPPPMPAHADLRDGYGAQLLDADDARQASPELAAWTLASAAALAVPGVASITWFEEWGPRGIRTADGRPLPVAAAVDALRALQGGPAVSGASADGLIRAVGTPERGLLVANLDRRTRELVVDGVGAVRLAPSSWIRTPSSGPWGTGTP